MEPHQSEKSFESRSEVETSSIPHPERKRRFRIVKLEERIAPGGGGTNTNIQHCGTGSEAISCFKCRY
jgi:hypothetical protein